MNHYKNIDSLEGGLVSEKTQISPTSPEKHERLVKLEKDIEDGRRQSFKKVGAALAEILKDSLYSPEFTTFEEYCVRKLNFKRAHGYRHVDAFEIAKTMSPFGDITKETHARALASVPVERRGEVFMAAINNAKLEGCRLMARHILDAFTPPSPTVVATSDTIVAATPNDVINENPIRVAWDGATPTEQRSFSAWLASGPAKRVQPAAVVESTTVVAPPANEPVEENQYRFICNACEEPFEDDRDAVSLYECSEDGTLFTRETSACGNHQCPDCNKFGSKISNQGCPLCNEGELQEIEKDTQLSQTTRPTILVRIA